MKASSDTIERIAADATELRGVFERSRYAAIAPVLRFERYLRLRPEMFHTAGGFICCSTPWRKLPLSEGAVVGHRPGQARVRSDAVASVHKVQCPQV